MSDKLLEKLAEVVNLLKTGLSSPSIPKISTLVGKDNAVKDSALAPSLRLPGASVPSKTQQLAGSASSKSLKDPVHQAKHIKDESAKAYAMTQAHAQNKANRNPLAFGKSEAEEQRFYVMKDGKLISHSPRTEQDILSEYGSMVEAEKQGLKIVPVVKEFLRTAGNGQWELAKRAPEGVDPDKHEECVMDLKEKGKDVGSAHAICTASMKKDDIDEKIKAKMRAEMDKRKFGEADAVRHIIDRDRGEKQPPKPKTPKQPLLQTESLTKDNSVKPFGTSIYNETANLGRKASRTGETVEGAGKNVGVRSYTTSGSSNQQAHEAREAKRQKKKSLKTVRTMQDMSEDELDAIKTKHGLK